MRIVAEPLASTNQLLVRLLGSDILFGLYQIDATPAIREVVDFEVFSGMVRQDEVRIYLTGFLNDPENIKVTKPDTSVIWVTVGQVELPKEEDFTIEQPVETITKEEKPVFQQPPADKIETVSPPEIPKQWFELFLERSTPLILGNYVTATPLTYQGGCKGRAVSATSAQEDTNKPPFLSGAAPRIEGQWSNTLENSSFSLTESRSGLLDKVPQGWDFDLANPSDLLRFVVKEANPLPSLQITWRVSDLTGIKVLRRLTTLTPIVTANRVFQVLVSTSAKNEKGGYIQLQSSSGAYSSQFALEPGIPVICFLDVEDDSGPVSIHWYQRSSDYTNQEISLVAPMSSDYGSIHSYAPPGRTSSADVIELNNIEYQDRTWFLKQGTIRVDSDVEFKSQPISWELKWADGSYLLRLANGILSSSFSSTTITLSNYLADDLNEAGNYKIKWSQDGFKLVHRLNPQGTTLPFAFDIPFSSLSHSLNLKISSFAPNLGTGVLRYFGFLPKA